MLKRSLIVAVLIAIGGAARAASMGASCQADQVTILCPQTLGPGTSAYITAPWTFGDTVTITGEDTGGFSLKTSSGIDASHGCITLEGGQVCGPGGGSSTVYASSDIILDNLPAFAATGAFFGQGMTGTTITFTSYGYDVKMWWSGSMANLSGSGTNCVIAPFLDGSPLDPANPQAGILNSFAVAGYGPMSMYRAAHVPAGVHSIYWDVRNTDGSTTCETFNDGNNQNQAGIERLIPFPF